MLLAPTRANDDRDATAAIRIEILKCFPPLGPETVPRRRGQCSGSLVPTKPGKRDGRGTASGKAVPPSSRPEAARRGTMRRSAGTALGSDPIHDRGAAQ